MVAKSLLAAGLLAAGANAAIVISNPVTGQTWFKNDSVALNWTAGPDDPAHFRIMISNPNTALLPTNPQELANEVPTANNWVGITLGMVQPGEDFTVQFVNTTNTSQVYAEVKEIKVENGIPATSTHPIPSATSAPATTSTSTNQIPNAGNTQGTTTSSNPFATSSKPAGGAGANTPAVAGAAVLAVVAAALAL